MAETFRAFMVDEQPGSGRFKEIATGDLPTEKVLVDIQYSSLNYKDGLCVTGKGKIARSYPMVPGIDLAGTVLESADPRFTPGQAVLAHGYDIGVNHDGGLAELARIPGDWIVQIGRAHV